MLALVLRTYSINYVLFQTRLGQHVNIAATAGRSFTRFWYKAHVDVHVCE